MSVRDGWPDATNRLITRSPNLSRARERLGGVRTSAGYRRARGRRSFDFTAAPATGSFRGDNCDARLTGSHAARRRYAPVQSVQQIFAPLAVQGSAAPEMQTVPSPRASSQSASVVQICPPHAPSRQTRRDAQSLSLLHWIPWSPLQVPLKGPLMLHVAAATQSELLVHARWDRPGGVEQAQHSLVVGIAQQLGLPPQVTMLSPQTVVGVAQADAP
jgi:hypothetical protein